MRTLGLLLLLAAHYPAQTAAVAQTSRSAASDNAELKEMFDEDQGERTGKFHAAPNDHRNAQDRDRERLARVAALMEQGAAKTANDYFHAAVVYQHGGSPEDYLRAHELAILAAAKGNKQGLWLSAASLDRFLMQIGRPQVFGTQFNRAQGSSSWTMEPYDRSTSDLLRKEFGVPSKSEQEKKLSELNQQAQRK